MSRGGHDKTVKFHLNFPNEEHLLAGKKCLNYYTRMEMAQAAHQPHKPLYSAQREKFTTVRRWKKFFDKTKNVLH